MIRHIIIHRRQIVHAKFAPQVFGLCWPCGQGDLSSVFDCVSFFIFPIYVIVNYSLLFYNQVNFAPVRKGLL